MKQLSNISSFFIFQGIPYAKPPVGKLRFKRTEPLLELKTDGSPFRATSFGRRCFQPSGLYYPSYVGQEDCLTLNVFVPNTNEVRFQFSISQSSNSQCIILK